MLPYYILHTLDTSEDLKILKLLHSVAVNVSRLFQSTPVSKEKFSDVLHLMPFWQNGLHKQQFMHI